MDAISRLRPVLVNRYELATDRLLTRAANEHGDRLLAKVRLADVVDMEEWTGELKRYGLSAHLDFVMVDTETSMPRFAVELDGSQHWNDQSTRRRDKMKDQLCEWAQLPLLRITSDFTRDIGRWTVLSYAIDAFYLSEAFFDAQEAGYIPDDEPFIVTSTLVPNAHGRLDFNALDQEARLWLLGSYERKELPCFGPDQYWTRDTFIGAVQAHAWMAVGYDRYIVARTRVRDCRFQGVTPGELAGQLAIIDVAEQAKRWLAGDPVACNSRTLARYMHDVQQAIDAGGFLGCTTGHALKPGGEAPAVIQVRFK